DSPTSSYAPRAGLVAGTIDLGPPVMQSGRMKRIARILLVVHVASLTAPAFANPQGGAVVQGAAGISSAGSVLTVQQSSNRAVINWQSFSNAAGETVRFVQPPAGATLN